MSKIKRNTEISIFNSFLIAVNTLCKNDKSLLKLKKTKLAITHRLALYLENEFSSLLADLSYPGELCPDIIVHDRSSSSLAIFISEGYLKECEKEKAKEYSLKNNVLTLALSLQPGKDYFLIYRFGKNYTDYLHLSKIDLKEKLLKRIETISENKEQLLFKIPKSKS